MTRLPTLTDVAAAAEAVGLAAAGAFHPGPEDAAPARVGTLVLLAPAPHRFWPIFSASAEAADDAAHPVDRWSRRVVGGLAEAFGAVPLFPFDGPPWRPFLRWAERSRVGWSSPVGMLVHAERGLWISYRGALGLPGRLDLPLRAAAKPCDPCPAPCRTACPVDAFTAAGYDAAACRAHLESPAGAECRGGGCLARRACPVGRDLAPPAEQAAYHLRAFRRA